MAWQRRQPRRRVGLVVVSTWVVVLAGLISPAAPAAGASGLSSNGQRLLDHPASGSEAIAEVGHNLGVAAARNKMTADDLRHLLLSDHTVRLDQTGRIFYVDGAPSSPPASVDAAEGAQPYSQTFLLHSDPGAQRVIYLDFKGDSLAGTYWDHGSPALASPQQGLDTDGSPSTFSNSEQDIVQSVWARVSEDYAPFDVDVTTEDPGQDAIDHTSASDQVYGARVSLIWAPDARVAICPTACGGIAYYFAFNHYATSRSMQQPALVFLDTMYNDPKNIAEAASHEVGHTLGLRHDGTSSLEYFPGHGAWAPIMGTGYTRPITQFSAGEYSDANNQQDDLAVIPTYGAPLRADDHGDTLATAEPLAYPFPGAVPGLIGTRTDVDMFRLDRPCGGSFSATVAVPEISPNLDAQLSLYAADGSLVDRVDPPSAMSSVDVASGMGATLSTTLPAGTYYLGVDGVGSGNPSSDGYSDYASIGRYTLTASGCSGIAVPPAPLTVAADVSNAQRSATLTWTAPASTGGSAITGYRVARTGSDASGGGSWSTTVSATSRSRTFLNLLPGHGYRLSVQAINASGQGAAATVDVTVGLGAPSVVGAISLVSNVKARSTVVKWAVPRSNGGSSVTAYRVTRSGVSGAGPKTLVLGSTSRSARFDRLRAGANYTFTVQAVNAAGRGAAAGASLKVSTTVPGAVRTRAVSQTVAIHAVKLSWSSPVATGGSRITGYRVRRSGTDANGLGPTSVLLKASARSLSFANLVPGQTYALYVQPVNKHGVGRGVMVSVTVSGGFPTVPTAVSVQVDDVARTATLTWAAPDSTGATELNAYRVTRSGIDDAGEGPWSTRIAPGLRSFTFTDLVPGQTYVLGVQAVNVSGPGPDATRTVTFSG